MYRCRACKKEFPIAAWIETATTFFPVTYMKPWQGSDLGTGVSTNVTTVTTVKVPMCPFCQSKEIESADRGYVSIEPKKKGHFTDGEHYLGSILPFLSLWKKGEEDFSKFSIEELKEKLLESWKDPLYDPTMSKTYRFAKIAIELEKRGVNYKDVIDSKRKACWTEEEARRDGV